MIDPCVLGITLLYTDEGTVGERGRESVTNSKLGGDFHGHPQGEFCNRTCVIQPSPEKKASGLDDPLAAATGKEVVCQYCRGGHGSGCVLELEKPSAAPPSPAHIAALERAETVAVAVLVSDLLKPLEYSELRHRSGGQVDSAIDVREEVRRLIDGKVGWERRQLVTVGPAAGCWCHENALTSQGAAGD